MKNPLTAGDICTRTFAYAPDHNRGYASTTNAASHAPKRRSRNASTAMTPRSLAR